MAWVGGSVSALVILFFLRGIVNSPHPEGLWILNGLWRWGKNSFFFNSLLEKWLFTKAQLSLKNARVTS